MTVMKRKVKSRKRQAKPTTEQNVETRTVDFAALARLD
jgi:hypothetical protein